MPLDILERHPGWARLSDEKRQAVLMALEELSDDQRSRLYAAIEQATPTDAGRAILDTEREMGRRERSARVEDLRERAMRTPMSASGEYLSVTGAPMSRERDEAAASGAAGMAMSTLGGALVGPARNALGPVVGRLLTPKVAGIAHGAYSLARGEDPAEAVLKGAGTAALLGGGGSAGQKVRQMASNVVPGRWGRLMDLARRGVRPRTGAAPPTTPAVAPRSAVPTMSSPQVAAQLGPEIRDRVRMMEQLGIPEQEMAHTLKKTLGDRVAGGLKVADARKLIDEVRRSTPKAAPGVTATVDSKAVRDLVSSWRGRPSWNRTKMAAELRNVYGRHRLHPAEARRLVDEAFYSLGVKP